MSHPPIIAGMNTKFCPRKPNKTVTPLSPPVRAVSASSLSGPVLIGVRLFSETPVPYTLFHDKKSFQNFRGTKFSDSYVVPPLGGPAGPASARPTGAVQDCSTLFRFVQDKFFPLGKSPPSAG